jgi:hypothetical protein
MKTSLVLLAFALTGLSVRATVTEKFAQTYPLAADGIVRIDNVNGFVEVVGWDRNEVSLEAEKRAPDEDSRSASTSISKRHPPNSP